MPILVIDKNKDPIRCKFYLLKVLAAFRPHAFRGLDPVEPVRGAIGIRRYLTDAKKAARKYQSAILGDFERGNFPAANQPGRTLGGQLRRFFAFSAHFGGASGLGGIL